ncbi:MAG: sigma-70 family RNA polymerase sigma factor [Planctomycetales bacterium]|nr:sigma-70 family RNA polymerase sigma factor [Planctomycetales bacterium]
MSHESDNEQTETDLLFQLAYAELHEVACSYMQRERDSHTLSPTALLNEAYIRLAGSGSRFRDYDHFAATAATVMRHILVNHAKAKRTAKRGKDWIKSPLDHLADQYDSRAGDLVALDAALEQLELVDNLQRRLVDLRFFAGFTMEQAADALGISARSAYYEWAHVRAWLRQQLAVDIDGQ